MKEYEKSSNNKICKDQLIIMSTLTYELKHITFE
jgi:hypothetical protein